MLVSALLSTTSSHFAGDLSEDPNIPSGLDLGSSMGNHPQYLVPAYEAAKLSLRAMILSTDFAVIYVVGVRLSMAGIRSII